jgi:hypothetical protein
MVSLTSIPRGLLEGLPQEDQNAIVAIVGKPVLLVGYEEDGRAELHFDDRFDVRTDDYSHSHSDLGGPRVHRPTPVMIEISEAGRLGLARKQRL